MGILWQLIWVAIIIYGIFLGAKKLRAYGEKSRAKMSPEKLAKMQAIHGWAMNSAAEAIKNSIHPLPSNAESENNLQILDGRTVVDARWTNSGRSEWRDKKGNFLGYAD